jgi:hypothetical protein
MVDSGQLDISSPADRSRELPARAAIHHAVAATVEDERRDVDRREDGSQIDVQEHLEDLLDHRRARTRALQAGVELHGLGIVRKAGSEQLDDPLCLLPPIRDDELDCGLPKRLRGRRPRIVGRFGGAPHGAVEHQGAHALWTRGR